MAITTHSVLVDGMDSECVVTKEGLNLDSDLKAFFCPKKKMRMLLM
jgi:hypothetical protein